MQNEFNYDKALADKLTIVLPLKGRPLFTIRYFLYMEAVKCPFKILIADGSLDEENKKVIDENKHRWPHVNFEYYRFPPDNTLLDFQRKMVGILGRVTTPYVMWNSNDDFYVIDTMFECVNFLEEDTKQEYVGCGGKHYRFIAIRNKIKKINLIKNSFAFYNFTENSAFKRILEQIPYKGACLQYAVIRKNIFEKCCLYVSSLQLNLLSSEYFFVRMFLFYGKFFQKGIPIHFWASDLKFSSASSDIPKMRVNEFKKANDFLITQICQQENLKEGFVRESFNKKFKNTWDWCSLSFFISRFRWILKLKKKLTFCFYSLIPQNIIHKLLLKKHAKNPHAIFLIKFLNNL